MKHFSIIFIYLFAAISIAAAQDFVTRGKIEYEVKRKNKRMYTAQQRADNPWISALPEFDISYRELIFSWNQSIYQYGRKGNSDQPYNNENVAYINLDKQQVIKKQRFIDEYNIMEDSVKKIRWKLENETRKIAGWECRKAVGRIYDSIYVVAFYCPEIVPQGGPELFTGLPGMILGVAIPRFYTTWFATKIEIASIDETNIIPPVIKKSKQYSKKELADILLKKYKEAGWWKDVTLEKVLESISGYML